MTITKICNISGNKKDNGKDTITFTFPSLTQEGTYTVEVTPRDLASNVSLHPVTFTFSLELKLPVVTEVKISDEEPRLLLGELLIGVATQLKTVIAGVRYRVMIA